MGIGEKQEILTVCGCILAVSQKYSEVFRGS
jgi:hypothetical protein